MTVGVLRAPQKQACCCFLWAIGRFSRWTCVLPLGGSASRNREPVERQHKEIGMRWASTPLHIDNPLCRTSGVRLAVSGELIACQPKIGWSAVHRVLECSRSLRNQRAPILFPNPRSVNPLRKVRPVIQEMRTPLARHTRWPSNCAAIAGLDPVRVHSRDPLPSLSLHLASGD